ncbi:MAG: hypothetical protein QOH93_412, partial [Chloroflexia bacterium]|nr:hypothetical protein [Chloroflexia bacterium]
MSLTSHLAQGKLSPIGRYFCERFPNTQSLVKDANHQLRNAETIRPAGLLPPDYSTLGSAIDHRIRYSFSNIRSEQLTARSGASMLALRPLDSVDAVPIPPEELVDILSSYSIMTLFNPMSDGAAYGPYPPNLLKAFFESLDETVARMQPSGRRLNGKDERLLARYCYLL